MRTDNNNNNDNFHIIDCVFCQEKVDLDTVNESKNILCPKCGSVIGGPVWPGMPAYAYEILKKDVEKALNSKEKEHK